MISVCIATYNGEKYLREQIESILSQLGEDDEVIISDDGSTDSTLDILYSFKDERIRIYNNEEQHGVNSNFENALRHACGDYIFLSDQDDVWLDGKVENCCKTLNSCDCVIHDAIVVDQSLNTVCKSFFAERNSGKGFWKNIYKNTYLGCCMAFRRDILKYCLPIPITTAYFHDNWIGSIADLKYRFEFIPFKGILFRRHDNNTSSTANRSKYSLFQQFKNRVKQMFDVVRRII